MIPNVGKPVHFGRRGRASAFTLVELLVVIAIIAVLIAILLPSLNAAKQQAQTVQCESNMRQVGAALINYCSDNFGRLPIGTFYDCTTGSAPSVYEMPDLMGLVYGGYIPQSPLVKNVFYTTSNQYTVYAPPVLQCPAYYGPLDLTRPGAFNGTTTARWQNVASGAVTTFAGADPWEGSALPYGIPYGIYTNYIFSHDIQSRYSAFTINGIAYHPPFACLALGPGAGFTGTMTPLYNASGQLNYDKGQINISTVRHSDQTWAMWEAWDGDIPQNSVLFRHPNLSCNFLYFDGHVENLHTYDIATNTASPGGLLDLRLVYNRD